MPGKARTFVLAGAIAAVLAGCGSDDDGTIPEDRADGLLDRLQAVEEQLASNCELAQDQAETFLDDVDLLPAEVGEEVKGALREAGVRLVALTADPEQCTAQGATDPAGVEPPETEPTTEPTTTEETTTEEEPEDEEDGEEQEEEPDEGGPPPGGEQPPGGGGEGESPGQDGGISPESGGIGGDTSAERRGRGGPR
jgi:hypothetical protein